MHNFLLMIELIILFAGNLSPLDPYVVMLYWFLDLRFSVANCDPHWQVNSCLHATIWANSPICWKSQRFRSVCSLALSIPNKVQIQKQCSSNTNYQNIFGCAKRTTKSTTETQKYDLISLFWSFHNSIQQQMVIVTEKHKKQWYHRTPKNITLEVLTKFSSIIRWIWHEYFREKWDSNPRSLNMFVLTDFWDRVVSSNSSN